MIRNITTANGTVLTLSSDDVPLMATYFEDANNYSDVVLDQINNTRMYDKYFQGKKDLVVIDAGANIGLFTMYASTVSKKIYAIEPTELHTRLMIQFIARLSVNKNLNMGSIAIVPGALGGADGDYDFYTNPINTTMNSLVNQYGGETNEVKCYRLDTFLDNKHIEKVDFCKVDIEGGEMIAFTDDILQKVGDRVKMFFLEVHATNDDGKSIEENMTDRIDLFKRNGYAISDVTFDSFIGTKE